MILILDGKSASRGDPQGQWRCPECGRTSANANQWHSCGTFRAEDNLDRAEPTVLDLHRRFERMVRRCGAVTLMPTKDRIRFRALVQFASAQVQRDALRVGLILPRKIQSPRVEKISTFTPGRLVDALKIRGRNDLDAELQSWLREAYAVGRTRGPATRTRSPRKD